MKYLLLSLLLIFIACEKRSVETRHTEHQQIKKEQNKIYYTCPMHPHIKENKAGKCPICHMNLNKVEVESTETKFQYQNRKNKVIWYCKDNPEVTSEIESPCPLDGTPMIKMEINKEVKKIVAKVILRKSQLSHFKPDYFPATKMKMSKDVRLLGTVLQAEEKESNIPARISGRVEKVYIKSKGVTIKKNDPLIDIYSPNLITGAEEYLVARESYLKNRNKEFKELVRQSEEKLLLWGIRKFQLEKWFHDKKVPKKITLYSSKSGIVSKRNALQGKYFKEGESLFDLVDYSFIWVEMDVYESDSALIKMGQDVRLNFLAIPGKVWKGKIDFISPELNSKSRTLKVRATLDNHDGSLRPGMVADANLTVHLPGPSLVVPRTAIIDTGKRKVVWIKTGFRTYMAKKIQSGFESQGYVEVKEGLKENEEVVTEGNFLLDAQAQLFGGYEEMSIKDKIPHGHHH